MAIRNDLRQPLNMVNLMVAETVRAGQKDRKIVSALYRFMDRNAKSDQRAKTRALTRLMNLTSIRSARQ